VKNASGLQSDAVISAVPSGCGDQSGLNERTDLHISTAARTGEWGNATATETLNNVHQRLQGMGRCFIDGDEAIVPDRSPPAVVMGYGDAFFMLTLSISGLSVLVIAFEETGRTCFAPRIRA